MDHAQSDRHTLALSCRCGTLTGRARPIDPRAGTRVVCYCKDCQAFARVLGVADRVLDRWGGTDIYQLPPARIELLTGQDQLRCLRLSEKGLYRWYAGCCQTPIGNTLSAGVPVVGLIHAFFADPTTAETILGPVRAHVHIGSATDRLPEAVWTRPGFRPYLVKIIGRMLAWKLRGLGRPTPFFTAAGAPVCTPRIATPDTPEDSHP